MVQQRFSSMDREIRTIIQVLHWVQAEAPVLMQNCRLQYQTDSQAAKFCVVGIKGAHECLSAEAEVDPLCADIDIEVAWRL